jgi:hypothetical protein
MQRRFMKVGYSYCPSVVGFELSISVRLAAKLRTIPSPGGIFRSVIIQPVTISNVQFFAIGGVF